jgi:hypothetical protein
VVIIPPAPEIQLDVTRLSLTSGKIRSDAIHAECLPTRPLEYAPSCPVLLAPALSFLNLGRNARHPHPVANLHHAQWCVSAGGTGKPKRRGVSQLPTPIGHEAACDAVGTDDIVDSGLVQPPKVQQ